MTTDLSASVLEGVKRLAEKATPGERFYRPHHHDDWGCVKLASGEWLLRISTSRFEDTTLDAHRRFKTDPCEADGLFAAACHPAFVLGLIQEVERLRDLHERTEAHYDATLKAIPQEKSP